MAMVFINMQSKRIYLTQSRQYELGQLCHIDFTKDA